MTRGRSSGSLHAISPGFNTCWLSTNSVLSTLGGRRLHTGMRKVNYIKPADGAFRSFHMFDWPHGGRRKGMPCLAVAYPLMFGAWPLPRLDMIAMPCAKHASQVRITCGKSSRLRRIFSGRRCPRPRPSNCCLMFVRRRFHAEPRLAPVCRGSFLRCSRIFAECGNSDASYGVLRSRAAPQRCAFALLFGARRGLWAGSSNSLKLAVNSVVGRSGCSDWWRASRLLLARILMPCFK